MILQALKEYYDRKAADPNSDIAPEGFEKKEIPFLIVINRDGDFIHLEDTREQSGKRMIGKTFLLPRSRTRTGSKSFETTFLLWDHLGYLFQFPENDEKAARQHKAWMKSLNALPAELKQDTGVAAILSFYQNNGLEKVKQAKGWSDCTSLPSCNMTFRLLDDAGPVPCRPAVQLYVRNAITKGEDDSEDNAEQRPSQRCLITGDFGVIARTHGRTPINKDTKSLVAFQKNSGYDSYGKEQCYNAPVSKSAEFAYVTGLNTLLKSKTQRMQIGDTIAVFWSAKDSRFEMEAPLFFSEPPKDDPDRNTEAVKVLYASIWNGSYIIPNENTCFYILGLAPNSARIAVRFWHAMTVKEIGQCLKKHVDDLAIACGQTNPALPLQRLLRSIAVQEKDENIPPNLPGDTMRSILNGTPYPTTLLQAAIRRIRAEQAKKNKITGKSAPNVTWERAALIKACLNRSLRFNNPAKEKELTMSLDPDSPNIGYRLGRLFATLEKIQQEASPGINATIRDKFYGAASGTPVTVFGNLMRLKNHHLAKLENAGRRVFFEKLLGEIIKEIKDFPTHLPLGDQGRFAIGYYHQMQDFYTKKSE